LSSATDCETPDAGFLARLASPAVIDPRDPPKV
jgi:hypothetical protein